MPIDDEKVAELGFESGDLDYTWVAVSSIPRYRRRRRRTAAVVVKPSLAYVWLGMNQEAAPFDNPDVRRAVQYAIDVPVVLEAAYFGAAEPATGVIAPGLLGHREKVLYSYDPDKARELLDEGRHGRWLRMHARHPQQGGTGERRSGSAGASSPMSASRSRSSSMIPAPTGASATRRPGTPGRRYSCTSTVFRCSQIRASLPNGSRRIRSASGIGSAGTARNSARWTKRRNSS